MMRIHLLLIMRIIIVVSAFFSLHSIASEEINPASIESSEFDADFLRKTLRKYHSSFITRTKLNLGRMPLILF